MVLVYKAKEIEGKKESGILYEFKWIGKWFEKRASNLLFIETNENSHRTMVDIKVENIVSLPPSPSNACSLARSLSVFVFISHSSSSSSSTA